MHSPDLSQDNIAKIRALFPNCVTEAADDQGTIRLAVDFDQLRQNLEDHVIGEAQERFRLDWPGKREALLTANAPIAKTLRPSREDSSNYETTQNLFIEGDNLDALKLLQESYLGKVKMIYIDPPYNTGSDFIYNDDFAETYEEFLRRSNQVDHEGGSLVANPDSEGRYHSEWLSMIYSRLKVARNLLSDNGLIFISIGDDEQANLKKVCDEIFGVSNFLGCACRVAKKANNQGDYWSPNFDYILTYAKSKDYCDVFFGGVNYSAYNLVDDNGPRAGEYYQLVRLYMTSLDPLRGCTNQRYYIEAPDGTLLIPPGDVFPEDLKDGAQIPPSTGRDKVWRWSQESYIAKKEQIHVKAVRSSNLVDHNGQDVKWNVFTKTYLNDVISKSSAKPNSLIENHINQNSSKELGDLNIPFSYAKPSGLIKFLCEISKVANNDIVMDFFAGSGSTAHGVMEFNSESGNNARFVMVQLPEVLDFDDKDHKAGYLFCEKLGLPKNISEISKERIRRAGAAISKGQPHKGWNRDTGFRVLKIDSSNMSDVYYRPDEVKQDELFGQVDSVKPDRTAEDLLFQVLIDWGVELTLPINRETLQGKTVYSVDGNALIACFESGVTDDLVKDIAARAPLRAVFRDTSFARDADRINAEQLFRQLSPGTELKAI